VIRLNRHGGKLRHGGRPPSPFHCRRAQIAYFADGGLLSTLYKRHLVPPRSTSLLQGTLDLLILRALSLQELHGLGVARRVEQITQGAFQVKAGSLFPALHRLEESGWLASRWGVSENNRRAKYYHLTKGGRQQLDRETGEWKKISIAMAAALQAT
jgi:PadR family transcriptional regulator, regulatory protein PadR